MYDLFANFYYISQGLYLTILITFISVCIGIILGFTMASIIFYKIKLTNLFKNNKYIPAFFNIINLYTKITVNTPILTQLMLFLFVIPINLNVYIIGILVLGLNSAAHVTTIILDSLNNIPENYWYTTISLGLTPYYSMKKVFIKYLIIHNKKAIFNEFIALLKESSILSLFGIREIVARSKEMSLINYDFLPYTLFVTFLYFFIISISEYLYNKFFTK